MYSIARLDALDALDAIIDLDDATELKSKLLFSVVVVSSRLNMNVSYSTTTWAFGY